MEQNLQSVVLLVLNRVETEVNFGEQQQIADELELGDALDQVQWDVEEAQCGDLLEAGEVNHTIFWEIKFAESL